MFPIEKLYRSLIYHMSELAPSGVSVVEGESYGVRFEDPTGKNPSVTVTMENIAEQPIELGSFGTNYSVVYTITALSRLQRDALKSIVYSGLLYNPVQVYSAFQQYAPASGAIVERIAESQPPIIIRDMPNFESDRERFFWVSIVSVGFDTIGL